MRSFFLQEAILRSQIAYDVDYFTPPATITYTINLALDTSADGTEINLNGIATRENDSLDHGVHGKLERAPYYTGLEISLPIYLKLAPQEQGIIRFCFSHISIPTRGRIARSGRYDIEKLNNAFECARTLEVTPQLWSGKTTLAFRTSDDEYVVAKATGAFLFEAIKSSIPKELNRRLSKL
jgi:hypothetical protein